MGDMHRNEGQNGAQGLPLDIPRILVVEDAADFQLMVRAALVPGFQLVPAVTLGEARVLLAREKFDLLILDVSLPDGEGYALCGELRADGRFKSLPVIFLSARGELRDKLQGFSLGADDYIVKPFAALELRARVESKLARLSEMRAALLAKAGSEGFMVKGPLVLEVPAGRAYVVDVDAQGRRSDLQLTPIEFKILFQLARHEGSVVSRERLLAVVWGEGTHVFDRATDKHVSSLRHKLGAHSRSIQTISGVGYRFNTPSSPL